METLTFHLEPEKVSAMNSSLLFAGVVGFFFIFRVCLTFLFFQSDPVAGSIVNIGIDFVLLYGAIFYTTKVAPYEPFHIWRIPAIRWLFAFLLFSLVSIAWTGAQSASAALVYWAGTAADIVIVFLLLRHGDAEHYTEGLMKGTVWGGAALSIVAWATPRLDDLRLGNETFLHPNTLGLELSIATLIAQYLASRGARWRWLGIGLAITLLRTLSKTSILAFAVAECWYLFQNKKMSKKTKMRIGALALIVVASFGSLLSNYLEIYNSTGKGDQAETLTGRTSIWAVAVAMGLEKPWFGHGLYSFKALIPSFGTFQPVHAHNEIIQNFFEYGVVGVVIILGLYWSFYRQMRDVQANQLKLLAVSLWIFALLHGLADTVPFGLSYPLWMMAALSVCLAKTTNMKAVVS